MAWLMEYQKGKRDRSGNSVCLSTAFMGSHFVLAPKMRKAIIFYLVNYAWSFFLGILSKRKNFLNFCIIICISLWLFNQLFINCPIPSFKIINLNNTSSSTLGISVQFNQLLQNTDLLTFVFLLCKIYFTLKIEV